MLPALPLDRLRLLISGCVRGNGGSPPGSSSWPLQCKGAEPRGGSQSPSQLYPPFPLHLPYWRHKGEAGGSQRAFKASLSSSFPLPLLNVEKSHVTALEGRSSFYWRRSKSCCLSKVCCQDLTSCRCHCHCNQAGWRVDPKGRGAWEGGQKWQTAGGPSSAALCRPTLYWNQQQITRLVSCHFFLSCRKVQSDQWWSDTV